MISNNNIKTRLLQITSLTSLTRPGKSILEDEEKMWWWVKIIKDNRSNSLVRSKGLFLHLLRRRRKCEGELSCFIWKKTSGSIWCNNRKIGSLPGNMWKRCNCIKLSLNRAMKALPRAFFWACPTSFGYSLCQDYGSIEVQCHDTVQGLCAQDLQIQLDLGH